MNAIQVGELFIANAIRLNNTKKEKVMPWTYNKMGYPGKKIGSLFGVITHIIENRVVDNEQISELTEMKARYYQDRYITPKDLNNLLKIASEAEERKTKKKAKAKKTSKVKK